MLVLKASQIHGVGVFTTTPIRKGQKISLFQANDWKLRRQATGYQQRYSIKDKTGWHSPANFHRMSIGWYLNHAPQPNVAMSGMIARSTCYIRAGAELTLDYEKL